MIINSDGGRKYTNVKNEHQDSTVKRWYESHRPDLGGAYTALQKGTGMNEDNAFNDAEVRTKPGTVPSQDKAQSYTPDPKYNAPGRLNLDELEHSTLSQADIHIPKPPTIPRAPRQAGKTESATKYEYMYGLRDIDIGYEQYQERAIFVSEPIIAEGNVVEMTLSAREEHPRFDSLNGAAAHRQTSAEYYIASVGDNPNPAPEDWMPILPEGETKVFSERLMFASEQTAGLRFPAWIGEASALYVDGIKMDADDWAFIDGGYAVQLMRPRQHGAIYAIDYTPNAAFHNPWHIDVSQLNIETKEKIEVFPEGTDHNQTIVLEEYPYVDLEQVNQTTDYDPNTSDYKPLQVTLKNADIVGIGRTRFRTVEPQNNTQQQVYTRNITDYKEGIEHALRKYSIDREAPYNVFEYKHDGRRLHFSEPFNRANIYDNERYAHGNAEIEVKYQYLSRAFRVKVILRRNSTDADTLAPIVHNYQLKFKVMK